MIVITGKVNEVHKVQVGDLFQVLLKDSMGSQILLQEIIKVERVIDYIVSFRFAKEDGECQFQLAGFFGSKDDLPEEMENAVYLQDLTVEQQQKFVATVGIEL